MALRPARRAGAAGAADDSRRAGGRDRDRAPLPGRLDRAPLDAARHLVARHRRQRAGDPALRRAGAAREGRRLPDERPAGRNRRHLLRRPIPQRRDDHGEHHRARRDRRRGARRRPRRRRPGQPARHRARRHSAAAPPERLRAHRRAVAMGAGGGRRSSPPRPCRPRMRAGCADWCAADERDHGKIARPRRPLGDPARRSRDRAARLLPGEHGDERPSVLDHPRAGHARPEPRRPLRRRRHRPLGRRHGEPLRPGDGGRPPGGLRRAGGNSSRGSSSEPSSASSTAC